MRELMMDFLYLLVIILSVMGGTAAILIIVGMVKGVVGMVEDAAGTDGHDEEDD